MFRFPAGPTIDDYYFELEAEKDLARVNPFKVFGAYPEITSPYVRNPEYNVSRFAIVRQEEYCDKVDFYNLDNQENILKRNYFTDYPTMSTITFLASTKPVISIPKKRGHERHLKCL